MKNYIYIFIMVAALTFWLYQKNSKTIDDFSYLCLKTHSTASGEMVYEITKQENSLLLEYYFFDSNYSSETNDYQNYKKTIHKKEVDLAIYQDILIKINNCKITKWDNFHKTNHNVLDGGGFSFVLKTNKKDICASGNNASPKHYGEFEDYLYDLICRDQMTTTNFENNRFKLLLPNRWLKEVYITYHDEYYSFDFYQDNKFITFYIIYENFYGYNGIDGYDFIGLLEKENEELSYLYGRKMAISSNIVLSNQQKEIIANLDSDLNKTLMSIETLNGYQLTKQAK